MGNPKSLTSWMKFVGIVILIDGVLSAIGGLFAFVIRAVPEVLFLEEEQWKQILRL